MKITALPAFLAVLIALACPYRMMAASSDPLTGLPLYPGSGTPTSLPKTKICNCEMKGNFYIVVSGNISAVNHWYADHLPGFRMYHAVTDGRTQDTFFNADGTKEVTITGSRGVPEEVFSISYGEFRPGLSQNAMASFNKPNRTCD